jgi:hypothetical protein
MLAATTHSTSQPPPKVNDTACDPPLRVEFSITASQIA